MVGIGRATPQVGPARGDVHFVDLPDVGGNVIRGPHPVVVVRTDRMQRSTTVIVVPMTSSPRSASEGPPYLVPVRTTESGLARDGFVKCDQPTTLPVAALRDRVGRLNPEAMDRVDRALRFVFGL